MKGLAVLFMLIDHIGLVFFPNNPIWRMIGRLAMPIFAFGIASGFYYTKSLTCYIKRILIFALVSQIPYALVCQYAFGQMIYLNIGFTFLSALICLGILEDRFSAGLPRMMKCMLLIFMLLFVEVLHVDYGIYGVLTVIIFYYFYMKQKQPVLGGLMFIGLTFLEVILYQNTLQSLAIFSVFLLYLPTGAPKKQLRYFFYYFYPLHLLVLYSLARLGAG